MKIKFEATDFDFTRFDFKVLNPTSISQYNKDIGVPIHKLCDANFVGFYHWNEGRNPRKCGKKWIKYNTDETVSYIGHKRYVQPIFTY